MRSFKIDIVSESRWKGVREMELEKGTKAIYIGKPDTKDILEPHIHVFMISKKAYKTVIEWSAIRKNYS